MFLGIPCSSISRSACNLEELPNLLQDPTPHHHPHNNPSTSFLDSLSTSSSSSNEEHSLEYMYELQTELERLRYRVLINYCAFFHEFSKVCHLSLASTRLILVVQKITRQ